MKAIVLAGGEGRRLGGIAEHLPKPMVTVLNEPLLEHTLRQLEGVGATDVYVNLYHRPGSIVEYLGRRTGSARVHHEVEVALTGPAGGAALFLPEVLNEPNVLVLSGDACQNVDLKAFVRFHERRGAELSVVMKPVTDAGRFGVARLDDSARVVGFEEKPNCRRHEEHLVSCGIYCVSPRVLERVPKGRVYDFGRDIIPLMAAGGGAVYGFVTDAVWLDVGSSAELLRANLQALSTGAPYPVPGRAVGRGIFAQGEVDVCSTAELYGPVLLGAGARVAEGVVIYGPSVIGPGARLERSSRVERSTLLAGARLSPGTQVYDAIVAQAFVHGGKE